MLQPVHAAITALLKAHIVQCRPNRVAAAVSSKTNRSKGIYLVRAEDDDLAESYYGQSQVNVSVCIVARE